MKKIPLGVKLEFGIDGFCRSLIRKMGLCMPFCTKNRTSNVCSADAVCDVTLQQQDFFPALL